MDVNQETVQKHVVVNSPGERREVLTERTETVPRESGPSAGTIAIIAIIAIAAIGTILYVVTSRNASEAANRNANLDVASQTQPVQQPAPAQQAPVIIQQPAQQAPVIIEQPATQPAPVVVQQAAEPRNTSANDDARMQDIGTRKLTEDSDMVLVIMTVTDARALLNGTVNSAGAKAKAEQIVKSVRGVKSVDNKLVVAG
jgi:hypothetical protein